MENKFSVTEMLSEIYQGFNDQHDREFIGMAVRKYFKKHKILPTDKESEIWFEENIGFKTPCSASSAIYKYRLFLKNRIKN